MLSNKKAKVPGLEREFRVIDRQQKVKEALFLYLLESNKKKEKLNVNNFVTSRKQSLSSCVKRLEF